MFEIWQTVKGGCFGLGGRQRGMHAARTRLAATASATMFGKGMGVGVTVGLAVAVGAGAAVSAADEHVFARASANRIKQSLFFMGWRPAAAFRAGRESIPPPMF